ncbi:hypothetical protein LCGC14_2941490, partial [marine sediment metagenome]
AHKHDFKRFPELTNSQMQIHYFQSPHKQILEPITARVVKVTDGDTIRVEWDERDFDFPIRMANLAAPELLEEGGKESQNFLEKEILGEDVDIILTKTRVEKWGRLLAYVINRGLNMGEHSINFGHAVSWKERKLEVGF